MILPGVLLPPAIPEWMRQKVGSYANPIIIEGLGAPLAVELRSFINIDSVRYAWRGILGCWFWGAQGW